MKRCGKSAPRRQQWRWQGKPHTEQDQIGEERLQIWFPPRRELELGRTCRLGASQLPGRSLEPLSNARPRGMTVVPLFVLVTGVPHIRTTRMRGAPNDEKERHTEFGLQAQQLRKTRASQFASLCHSLSTARKRQIRRLLPRPQTKKTYAAPALTTRRSKLPRDDGKTTTLGMAERQNKTKIGQDYRTTHTAVSAAAWRAEGRLDLTDGG